MKIKIKLIRRAEQPTSAQVVSSIDDLLTEILLGLPIKSLVRFKLVSKHWHSLIMNPKFCHLRNPNPNPALGLLLLSNNFRISPLFEFIPFSVKNPTNPPFRKLKFAKDPSGINIVQSCNGLLLCSSFRARDHNLKYYVYNPTTKRFTTLPKPDQETGIRKKISGMNLAFDPSRSPHYKVVCVQHLQLDQGKHEYQIEVYSSETGPWRVSSQPFTSEVNFKKGVYWNGSIHWISDESVECLYFNVDEERLKTMPMPMPMPPILYGWVRRINYYFGESCGHLSYIEEFGPQYHFNVYEMKRDYSEWFVKYEVDISPLVTRLIPSYLNQTEWYYRWSILCLIRDEKDKDSFLVLQIAGKVIRCNLVYETFETLHECAEAEDGSSVTWPNGFRNDYGAEEEVVSFTWTEGYQHIESLCCV